MATIKFPPHGSRTDRYHVVIDGTDLGFLSSGVIADLGLSEKTGVEMSSVPIIAEAIAALAGYDMAVRLLAVQARSRHDLSWALKKRGVSEAHITTALDRLESLGFLDDTKYAETFVRAKIQGAGHGDYRLRQELARHGIRGDIAEAAISETRADPSVDSEEALNRVVAKKMRSLSGLEPRVQRQRLFGFLARRGYNGDTIRRAVDGALRPEEDTFEESI